MPEIIDLPKAHKTVATQKILLITLFPIIGCLNKKNANLNRLFLHWTQAK